MPEALSSPIPDDQEILRRFAEIVSSSLRVPLERVVPDTSLDALGAESIDIVEISLETELEFLVLMPERTILQIGREVLGDGVLEREGVLTDAGRTLLAKRMPQIDVASWPDVVRVADLRPVFLRVDVWTSLIRFVLERSPRTCAACGVRLVAGTPARVKCPSCGTEFDLPKGDDLNREWLRTHMPSTP